MCIIVGNRCMGTKQHRSISTGCFIIKAIDIFNIMEIWSAISNLNVVIQR